MACRSCACHPHRATTPASRLLIEPCMNYYIMWCSYIRLSSKAVAATGNVHYNLTAIILASPYIPASDWLPRRSWHQSDCSSLTTWGKGSEGDSRPWVVTWGNLGWGLWLRRRENVIQDSYTLLSSYWLQSYICTFIHPQCTCYVHAIQCIVNFDTLQSEGQGHMEGITVSGSLGWGWSSN